MTFQPVVPLTGYSGWLFLERTVDTQRAAFNESAEVVRATDTFRERIGSIVTAEDLVADRELLSVALGAFGLDEDIDNKFFIRKVLEEGTTNSDALANRLSDSRYSALSEAFGFGSVGQSRTDLATFADEIINRYEAEQFEIAVGEQNNDMRVALNYATALEDVIDGSSTNDARWFSMMGDTALRTTFETALGFPSSFASVDLDQQLEQFKGRSERIFGTDQIDELIGDENQEQMIQLYMLRSEINANASFSSASVALTLLQQV